MRLTYSFRCIMNENGRLPEQSCWIWSPRGGKRGGLQKFSNFELGIEIYVKKSKESSGAIRFSKFLIFHKLQLFKNIFLAKISVFGAH